MDVQAPKTLPKLRTFAQDVERARQKNGITPAAPEQPLQKGEVPKLSAVTSTDVKESASVQEVKKDEHIPAFHELQKKSAGHETLKGPNITVSPKAAKQVPSAPKRTVSVRSKKPDLKATKHVGGGTIITDSKAGQFNLVQSITKSIDDWIKNLKRALKKKREPKYVITDTERRRGVIQKATSKTGSIFTADSETLKEQIRRRQATQNNEPDINWSPNTEPGYALLDSGVPKPTVSNVTVEFKKQSTPTPPTPAPAPVVKASVVPPPVFVEPTTTTVSEPEPMPEPTLPASAPEPVTTEETYEQPVESAEVAPEPESTYEPIPEEEQLTTPEEHYRIKSLGDITRINTNILSIGVVGAVAGLIIVIILIKALIGFVLPTNNTIHVEAPTPFANASAENLELASLSTESVTAALQVANYSNPTELRFVDTKGMPVETISALQLIGFTKNPNLNRTVTGVHIVVRGQERAIVFTVADSTTALGSLLSWEEAMPTDLSSTVNINTSDLNTEFTDAKVGLADVRVLKTSAGEERLVYGFINPKTIVISSNSALFNSLLGGN